VRLLNRSAGRLSRHRRGPLAGLLVILFGLLAMGGVIAAIGPATATKAHDTQAEVQAGRELFVVSCSFCHGMNAEGVLTENGQLGPSLVGVGSAAVDFQVGTGRMPMVQPGQQAATKDHVFSDEEIHALGAYIDSLAPGPTVPSEDEYSLDPELEGEELDEVIARGGELFLANCTACHNFSGSGGAMPWGKTAQPLKETSEKHLYEAMITGPQQMPVFSNAVLLPEDKAAIIAYLKTTEEGPEYGGFGMGGLGPVSEGLFAWLGGIGVLVGFCWWIAAHSARSEKEEVEA